MFHPKVFVPLWGLVHVIAVMYEELVSFPQVLAGFDGGHLPVAGMQGVNPLAVGIEAVIDLVSQSGRVVFRRLELNMNVCKKTLFFLKTSF